MILDLMVNAHKGAVFLFQPVINGVGGNLVSIQASRLSTALHQQTELGVLPDEVKVWITPWQAFFSDSKFIFIYRCMCIHIYVHPKVTIKNFKLSPKWDLKICNLKPFLGEKLFKIGKVKDKQ